MEEIKWKVKIKNIVFDEQILRIIFNSDKRSWTIWYEIIENDNNYNYKGQYAIEYKKLENDSFVWKIFYNIIIKNNKKILEDDYEEFDLKETVEKINWKKIFKAILKNNMIFVRI